MSTFIAHTSLAEMRPLGSDGERSLARVAALIERHLSARHAAVLADPVPIRDGSGIDWYTELEGQVRPLRDLAPEDAEKTRTELASILTDFRDLAGRLDDTGGARQQNATAALNGAAVFPDENCVYAVQTADGLRPVIVAWAHESYDSAAIRAFNVSAFGAQRPPRAIETVRPNPGDQAAARHVVQPVPPPAGGPSRGVTRNSIWAGMLPWLAGLIALAAFVLTVAILLPACGLRTPFGTIVFGLPGVSECSPTPVAEAVRTVDLERELAVVEQEYRRRRIECLASAQQTPVPVEPLPAIDEAFEDRVGTRGESQVTLVWEGPDDVDLSLRCPSGQMIAYNNKSGCGGQLDVDANASAITTGPAENITFSQGLQTDGPHRIFVTLYQSRSSRYPLPFSVRIRDANGERVRQGQLNGPQDTVDVDQMVRAR